MSEQALKPLKKVPALPCLHLLQRRQVMSLEKVLSLESGPASELLIHRFPGSLHVQCFLFSERESEGGRERERERERE